ncbi:RNA polymerase sigma factor [Kocuria massiliensis]|uniref:RNA polymerase sigma factor n=1 Tax=Kocuria massiliensis TaxID=1926282 RepID=UPI001FE6736A|nr:sigma-70 family RNA polymerase sigma factor [Kocuria massiliensis]
MKPHIRPLCDDYLVMDSKIPFEQVVQHHGPTVWRVCRGLLRSQHDAEDAWAETFAAGLKAWPDLPGTTTVEAWLVAVARHKAIDVARGNARRATPSEPGEGRSGGPNCSATSESAEETVLRDVNAQLLWAAVHQLPERQRLAVIHHHLGGLPYREVAALVGGREAAVRRAAADGLRSLRRQRNELMEREQ